jgi:hypothetical protein
MHGMVETTECEGRCAEYGEWMRSALLLYRHFLSNSAFCTFIMVMLGM